MDLGEPVAFGRGTCRGRRARPDCRVRRVRRL